MKKKLLLIGLSLFLLLTLSACASTDVVGKGSVASFEKVLQAMGPDVKEDSGNGGWALSAPDSGARFIWSKDYSRGAPYDIMLELDAQPFLAAGLNIDKLPEGMLAGDKIIVGTDLGNEQFVYVGDAAPLASCEKLVESHRERVKYHADLDHFGVDVGGGNMFEWAKDMGTNDKDIVFALDPTPFIEAGTDPSAVEGWVYAKVKVMEKSGKTVEVDKLLKPFSIQ